MVSKKKAGSKKAGKKAAGASKSAQSREPTVTMVRQPSKAAIPAPEKVSIEVLLRPAEGMLSPVSAEESIRFSNISNFRPTTATQDQAAKRLSEIGFKVVASSPYSISIE